MATLRDEYESVKRIYGVGESSDFQNAYLRAVNETIRELNVTLGQTVPEFSASDDVLSEDVPYASNELNLFRWTVISNTRSQGYTADDEAFIERKLADSKVTAMYNSGSST
jgi:hypothetical protein